ncbi:MAG: autotransporter-associated beta strand repeat-containing protein, partial [Bacteroidales bacterium]|nr:autotransporter-associated beta strand repeat-containing protein [Bacteroidales bacterium]
MADVSFDGTNLTGSGTYTSNISASGDLISKATDTSSTITLSNNTITVSGNYFHDLGNIVFENGTTTTISSDFNIRGDNTSTPAVTIDGTFTCGNFVVGKKSANNGATKGVLYITDNANITARGFSPIGNYTNSQGTVNQSGGTITFTNEVTQQSDDCIFRIGGYEKSTGTYNLSGGILNCLIAKACVGAGKNATGTFTITGGTANLKGLKMTYVDGSKGTLNLYGGELKIAGDGVFKGNGSNTTATINLGQGTVSALANHTWNSALSINLNGRAADSTANVANGQTTFNTDGKTITLDSKLTGVGALVKNGSGNLILSNTGNSFTGNIVINGGKVEANVAHSSYTTTALGAFSSTGGRTITINSGAELALGTNDVLGGGSNISNFNNNTVRLIINGGKLSGTNNNALYNATFQNGAEVYGNNNRDVWRSFWILGTNYVSFAGNGLTPETPVQFNGASGVIFVPHSAELNVDNITQSDASDLIVNVSFGNKSESLITTNSVTKTGAGTMEFT